MVLLRSGTIIYMCLPMCGTYVRALLASRHFVWLLVERMMTVVLHSIM